MKKILLTSLTSFLILSACSDNSVDHEEDSQNNDTDQATNNNQGSENDQVDLQGESITVGAASEINRQVLEDVGRRLNENTGIETEVVLIDDYSQNHRALDQGEIDANVFSYFPFINLYNEENNGDVTPIAYSYIAPMGVYGSSDIQSIEDIPEGALVVMPNDPVTAGHALSVLEIMELIEIDDQADYMATVDDIEENHLNLEFQPMPAPQLPRSLKDADLAVMGATHAVDGGLNLEDALYLQTAEETPDYYKLTIAVHEERVDDPVLHAYVDEYQTKETKDYAEEVSQGSYVPAWSSNDTTLEDFKKFVNEVN